MPTTDVASRLAPFGTTVFAEISARARAADAIDLGQGKPDFEGPDFVKDAAAEALRERSNQYAPHPGVPELREAIAADWLCSRGEAIDPGDEVTVTAGCTEAIPAAMLGLLEPGDRVVVFEPFYDCYPAALALAGAEPVYVALRRQHDGSFAFDPVELARACQGARALLVNTPHNPTGKVFTRDELNTIAESVIHHDLLVFADEVYDRLVYEGEHVSIATLPGMRGRTLTMGSLGKMFSLTGWKIGWIVAAPELTRAEDADLSRSMIRVHVSAPSSIALTGTPFDVAATYATPALNSARAYSSTWCPPGRSTARAPSPAPISPAITAHATRSVPKSRSRVFSSLTTTEDATTLSIDMPIASTTVLRFDAGTSTCCTPHATSTTDSTIAIRHAK